MVDKAGDYLESPSRGKKEMKRRIKRRLMGPLLPAKSGPGELIGNVALARTELRLLRIENAALRTQKAELAAIRASLSDYIYGLSLMRAP